MFKIKIYNRRFISLVVLVTLSIPTFLGCEKFLDKESNRIVNEENKWKDINDIRGSLTGIYSLLRTALGQNNAHWMYGELRSGDFVSTSRRDLADIIDGNLSSSFPLIEDLTDWRRFYAVIDAANLFIENSPKVLNHDPQYTKANNDIDIAQAKVIKAFTYYLLVRTWGDVPVLDKSYEGTFPKIEQTPANIVLTYAENLLLEAKDVLPYVYGYSRDPIYPTATYLGHNDSKWLGVLFNRLSAYSILAHINAWRGNYFEVVNYSNFVLAEASRAGLIPTDNINTLVGTTNEGFFYGNKGAHLIAFPFSNNNNEGTFDGHIESLTLASPLVGKSNPDIYVPVNRVLELFDELGDVRFHVDRNATVISTYFYDFGGVRPIFNKIHMIRGGSDGRDGSLPLFTSTLVFSRYEEINLLRAEAYAALGEVELAKSILNQQREKRGLPEIQAGVNLIDAIFNERNKELMGEGWKWFDLVRYKKLKGNDSLFNQLISKKGIYWPVSKKALENNSKLVQNPYWAIK